MSITIDRVTQIADKEGLIHQMKNIDNPNERDYNLDYLILIDKDFKDDVTTLVKRVLSVSRKLYEEKMRPPHARRSR